MTSTQAACSPMSIMPARSMCICSGLHPTVHMVEDCVKCDHIKLAMSSKRRLNLLSSKRRELCGIREVTLFEVRLGFEFLAYHSLHSLTKQYEVHTA